MSFYNKFKITYTLLIELKNKQIKVKKNELKYFTFKKIIEIDVIKQIKRQK